MSFLAQDVLLGMPNPAPASDGRPRPTMYLREAIPVEYAAMTPENLEVMEGTVGEILMAQTVLMLKNQYDIVEFMPRSELFPHVVQAIRQVQAIRVDPERPARRPM